MLIAAAALALVAVLAASPVTTIAQEQPAPSPAASPSPSPAVRVSPSPTPTPSGLAALFTGELGNRILVVIGVILIVVIGVAWIFSNRAEARPTPEQLEAIRQFVETDFARYVVRGLTARQNLETIQAPNISNDPAWRKVFVHQLDLHNEFYRLSKRPALELFEAHIDKAVARELEAQRARSGSSSA